MTDQLAPESLAAPAHDDQPATDVALLDDTPIERPTPMTLDELDAEHADRESRWNVQTVVTVLGLVALTAYCLNTIRIDKVFTAAVPTGGDMGAHNLGPAYLRDHLLPKWQLTGWSPDWYGGFPLYRYYMLPPALLVVLLDVVLPYGMAMKIVAVLGVVTLPLCACAFGRLARFAYPIPLLFAVGATLFLHDESFKIQGGNVASTMAGEFSFSIALSLSFLALGCFIRGMETGRYRKRTTLLIALTLLTHGIVALYLCLSITVFYLVWIGRRRWKWGLLVGVNGALLSMFWMLPFIGTTKFMTDMKYDKAPSAGAVDWENYWKMFFPHSTLTDRVWVILAVTGFVGALVRRHRNGAGLGILGILLVAAVIASSDGIPGFGLLWSTRVLPFLYLSRYLLGMLGVFELFMAVRRLYVLATAGRAATSALGSIEREYYEGRLSVARQRRGELWSTSTVAVGSVIVSLGWLAWHFVQIPFQKETYDEKAGYRMEWPHFGDTDLAFIKTKVHKGFVDSWALWNFTGFQGDAEACDAGQGGACKNGYTEFRGIVSKMKQLGEDPQFGCGRALWEDTTGKYGTEMAMMLLPFYTDGCIASSEGLFFESSATTPYHFLTVGAMSENASNPVRGLAYENKDATVGVREMQTLGIKYYMTWTPQAHERAEQQPDLVEVESARVGPWRVYRVAGSDLVVPLANTPVVVNARGGDQRERWLEVGTSYFQHPEDWPAIPAADGPKDWQRVDVKADEELDHPKVDRVSAVQDIEARTQPTANVTNVRQGDESLSFDVDTVGVPVLVKISYFPNWKVTGAEGPYRIAPNMMVVVPTSNSVRLEYGRTGLDNVSYLISFVGILLLLALGRLFKRFGPFSPADDEHLYVEQPLPLQLAGSSGVQHLGRWAPPSGAFAPAVDVTDPPAVGSAPLPAYWRDEPDAGAQELSWPVYRPDDAPGADASADQHGADRDPADDDR